MTTIYHESIHLSCILMRLVGLPSTHSTMQQHAFALTLTLTLPLTLPLTRHYVRLIVTGILEHTKAEVKDTGAIKKCTYSIANEVEMKDIDAIKICTRSIASRDLPAE